MDKKEILKNTKAREESVKRDKKRGIVAIAQLFLRQPFCSQHLLCMILMVSFGVLWMTEWTITLNFSDNQGFPYEVAVSKVTKIKLYCL